jgi:hypothetical protein
LVRDAGREARVEEEAPPLDEDGLPEERPPLGPSSSSFIDPSSPEFWLVWAFCRSMLEVTKPRVRREPCVRGLWGARRAVKGDKTRLVT